MGASGQGGRRRTRHPNTALSVSPPPSPHRYETFCNLGATLVDSLDTLWLMGLKKEFARARDWVVAESGGLSFDKDCSVSVFESTIRVFGGLLSAYDMSGDRAFVAKAAQLADRLLPAYNESALGFPRSAMNLRTGVASTPGWIGAGQAALLAELGTVQLELLKLSEYTGKKQYAETGERIIRELHARHPTDALLPIYVDRCQGRGGVGRGTHGRRCNTRKKTARRAIGPCRHRLHHAPPPRRRGPDVDPECCPVTRAGGGQGAGGVARACRDGRPACRCVCARGSIQVIRGQGGGKGG